MKKLSFGLPLGIFLVAAATSCSGSGGTEGTGGRGDVGAGNGTSTDTGGGGGGGGNDGGGSSGSGGTGAASGDGGSGADTGAGGSGGLSNEDCTDTGADATMTFFLTSWHHIQELSGSDDGFGGDLRYNGAATGLEGADALCQEMARRVCHGHKTWKAFLSTSTVDAIDRIGDGPWYDYAGNLVANDTSGLTSGNRPAGGCCNSGTYDELGTFHDGTTDVNNDGEDDDDHDTMTATQSDGTYNGFSCSDWTSTTAQPSGGGQGSGIMMGHSWPAQSGQSWVEAHAGHGCAAGTNFIQDGPGDGNTVGGGGGYGGFYCFAID